MALHVRCPERAPEGWSAILESDPDATPAHRPELWSALGAALTGFEMRVIVVSEDERLLGGAPVALERRAGMTWIHALPFLLPGAPIAVEGRRDEVDAAVAGALADLARERRAAGGEWACYRAAGAPIAASALERVGGETRWIEARVIDLSGGEEAFLRRMDRKTRQELRRPDARGIECAEEAGALEETYALHVRQARGWGGYRPLPLDLSRRLIAAGVARLFVARDGGGLLCGTLVLDGPHETFLWWSGAHPMARVGEANAKLMSWIVEWALGRGRLRVNLGASRALGPVERFKQSLGAAAVRYPVRWIDARHAPPLGRVAAALQRRLRRGRERGEEA